MPSNLSLIPMLHSLSRVFLQICHPFKSVIPSDRMFLQVRDMRGVVRQLALVSDTHRLLLVAPVDIPVP